MQVVPLALKEVMRADRKHDVQVAARAARTARIAFAAIANARAFFNTRRHFHIQLDLLGHPRLAAAVAQGSLMIVPAPPQALQVRATEKNPC